MVKKTENEELNSMHGRCTNTVKTKRAEIFYYLFWMIMLFAKGIGLYEGMKVYNLCLILAMLCLTVKLILTEYTLSDFIWMIPAVCMGAWVYLNAKDQSLFILVAVMIGLKGMSLSRVFKTGLLMWGACFVCMILKSLLFGDTGPVLAHEKLGLGPILRMSLSYTHPNVLHITYVVLAAFILYIWNLKPGRRQGKITAVLLAGNFYIFMYSVSFTGFGLMLILLICNFYLQNRKVLSKIEKSLLFFILPICVVFSLALPVVLKDAGILFNIFNKILNNRFLATRVYLEQLGITAWGIDVPPIGKFAIDCSYTEAILSYGTVIFGILMLSYAAAIYHLIKNNQKNELAIMLSLMIAGISEPFLFNASFKNITVLFMGKYLFEKSSQWGKRKQKSVLQIKIPMLSKWDKEDEFPVVVLKKWFETGKAKIKKHKKMIVLYFLIGFIIFAGATAILADRPDSVYIGVNAADCGEHEEKYLDMQELPEEFHSDVYMYSGPETPLYEFRGNMLTVEYVRKIISGGIWGSSIGMIAIGSIIMCKSGKKNEEFFSCHHLTRE